MTDSVAVVATYLADLARIRGTGAARRETSYYGPLENLLNAVGQGLKPKVHCVGQLADRFGVGSPDFGLFAQSQIQRGEPCDGAMPERGVVEVKGLGDEAAATADAEQVTRYYGRFNLVLVTNYRAFVLVGPDISGRASVLERFSLAATEASFWELAAHPQRAAKAQGAALVEYLTRVLTIRTRITEPKDLAWLLASYARDALARVEGRAASPGLVDLKKALEEALGIGFQGQKALHFFHSTLIQTLFYGLFSAWALWAESDDAKRGRAFAWQTAVWYLRVPLLSALFSQITQPTKLRPLGLVEVMDWAEAALARVDRTAFLAKFEETEAIQYFYEPFLAAFDPTLRDDLGVWYTPREIVRYMVERVDRVLRDELSLASGLADERVHVLDPCCGTGAFLVEVLRRIDRTLEEEGGGGLKGQKLRAAAMARIHGFEIMPAPFVVAHLRVGAFLQGSQVPFAADGSQRASIYLTNALTGWSDRTVRPPLPMPELADERDAAERVKHDEPILVILGNPPYNAFAGTSPAQEEGLVEPYKAGLQRRWGIRKFNLDDLYVRFLRIAERRIVAEGRGIVCYISSYSYLSDGSFVVLRESLLSSFDQIWIDSLNGDSRETGKTTPDGKPDPSVFSTEANREGIQQGTAVGLFLRRPLHKPAQVVRYRDFWGVTKRDDLLRSLNADGEGYQDAQPDATNRFAFRPLRRARDYGSWPRLIELCAIEPFNELTEKRRHALIDIDRDVLEARMRRYLDPAVPFEQLVAENCGPVTAAARFEPKAARTAVVPSMPFDPSRLRRYAYMPFDVRWAYHLDRRPIWNEPRPALVRQMVHGNLALTTRPAGRRPDEGAPISATTSLPNDHLFDPNTRAIPVRLHESGLLEGADRAGRANLSPAARRYLSEIGAGDPNAEPTVGAALWLHALAVAHAPAYLDEHRAAVVADYPHVPLPEDVGTLTASAALGQRLTDLLDPDRRAEGVAGGSVNVALRRIAVSMRADGRQLTDADNGLTANWGYHDRRGAVMPGQGRAVERSSYDADEMSVFAAGAGALSLTPDHVTALLGETTYDVWLNGDACWRNVPAKVWRYKIGGYQVIKKWLSYREHGVLGRALRPEEVGYVQEIARRIAAILLLGPALDACYAACKANPYSWPRA